MKISPYSYPGVDLTNEMKVKTIFNRLELEKEVSQVHITEKLCNFLGITTIELFKHTRKQTTVRVRYLLCSLLALAGYNYTTISKFVGFRDHAAVIHGLKYIYNDYNSNTVQFLDNLLLKLKEDNL